MTAPQTLHVITDADRRGAQVFAHDLHERFGVEGWPSRTVALAPAAHGSALPVQVLGATRTAPSTLLALRRQLATADVAVAHGSTTLPACAIAGVGVSTPFVYRQISDQLFWAGSTGRRLRTSAFLRRAARVVALWSGAADVLVEHFGVDRRRIDIIPNGVPAERFPELGEGARLAARTELGLDLDRPTLVSIGALVPEKGVDLAVRIAAAIPDAQLLVVGGGPENERLQRLAEEAAPGRVRFRGPVSEPSKVYAAADVVLLPSRGGDSMPAVLIEAAFTGRAAVSTTIGGIVDMIVPGSTGELVEPDDLDALIAATRTALEQADSYGTAARKHALERFEIAVVARAWQDVLRGL